MKVGLVGESPHDTKSVENLLKRVYPDITFVNLIHDIRGSQLDQFQPTKRILRLEFQYEKPDFVLFIRDLDALVNDKEQLEKRKEYFRQFSTVVDGKALYMLNIYEIEALILCDLESFMAHYSCECICEDDPHTIEKPKEHLKLLHNKYSEVHNSELFARMDHSVLLERSKYYKDFIARFDKSVS